MRWISIFLCTALLALPALAQRSEEEIQAEELIEAAGLARQLGDQHYTVRRLPEFETNISAIDARAEEIRRKGAVIRGKAADIRATADRIRRDSDAGKLNFEDLSVLIQGSTSLAREGAELGGEAAQLGNEAAMLGLRASRLGLTTAEAASYYSLGLPSAALNQMDARGTSSDSSLVQLARLKAADASGQPELAMRYGNEVIEDSPLVRYIAQSYRFQSENSNSLEAHLKARRGALQTLSRVKFDSTLPPQKWRWAIEAQAFWLADGSKYQDVELEDLVDQEFEIWESLLAAADQHSYELRLGLPELLFQQSDHILETGDLSQAHSWWQRGKVLTERIELDLAQSAGQLNSRFPELKVKNSPRLFILQGISAESRAHIALASDQKADHLLETAQRLYRYAQAEERELNLLIEWPKVRADKTHQMGTLATKLKHPLGLLVTQINQAELAYQGGQAKKADDLLDRILPEIRSIVAEQGVTSKEQRHYARAFNLQARIKAENGDAAGAMSTLSERGQMYTSATLGSSQAAPVRSIQQKRTRLRALREEQSAERALPPGAPKTVDSGALIATNKQEFVSTARELREKHPEYASLLFVDPVEFSKLQAKIPEGTLVLQYFPSEDGILYIFAVSSKSFRIRTVPVASKELARLVRRYRSIVGRFPPPPISWKPDGTRSYDYAKVFYRLHELLITPVEEEIAKAQTVAIIPAGHLHYLPFAGLARPGQGGPEFLIQRKQVVSLSKASDLALLKTDLKQTKKLLAFGNPDGTLPAAAQEVKGLEEVFPTSTVVLGAQATKARLRSDSPGAGYLHLATHGTLNNRDPNASYITMAGAAESGRLHPPEIFTLPLSDTRLVTMSACSTALGRSNPGAEVTSLAEAFWVAGAPSVMASLWKVSDDSTRDLMLDFYRGVRKGGSLAASLQEAQIKQLEGEFNHPFYWAPFILLGDWR